MTPSQKLQIRLSEIREKLNGFAARVADGDTLSEAESNESAELRTQMSQAESSLRDAIAAEGAESESRAGADVGDPEARERAELRARCSLAAYLGEAASGRALASGSAEGEYRAATLGDAAEPNAVPLEFLVPEPEVRAAEVRADAVTNVGNSVEVGNSQASIAGRVFSASASAFLGIAMPTAAPGTVSYPILTEGASAAQKNKGTATDAIAARFEADAIAPTRLVARYAFSVEDAARLRGMEESLAADLRMALSDAMDAQILAGDGSAPNVSGLLHALDAPTAPTAEATWADYVSLVAGQVDGKMAATERDVRLLVGSETYAHAAISLHATASVPAAASYVSMQSGGLRVSANLPDAAGTPKRQEGITARGRAGMNNAVAVSWPSVQLIRDPYTSASSGEVSLTATLLWGFRVIRKSAFSRESIRLA